MQRAASDVMQSVILSAVIEAIEAMKVASKGVPNTMLRELQTLHRNTTLADLPKPLQDSIAQSVRAAFTQLLKEGYAVGPRQAGQQSQPLDRVPERDRRTIRTGPGRRGPDRPGGGRPPGGRPSRNKPGK